MKTYDAEAAYFRAVRFIQYRPRSRMEVEKKLKTLGYPAESVGKAVERLTEEGWLDDENFAKAWAEAKTLSQLYGRIRVRHDLVMKGINGKTVDKILDELYNTVSEPEIAVRWLNKKYPDPREVEDTKLIQSLMRHGFNYSTSQNAVTLFRDSFD